MGNCFSDPSSHPKSKTTSTKGGQKLGSGPARPTGAGAAVSNPPPQPRYNEPPRVLGGGTAAGGVGVGDAGLSVGEEEQRQRMIQAAEARAKSQSTKGVTSSNPKSGQLSAKLAAERKAGTTSPRQQDERQMDKGQWN